MKRVTAKAVTEALKAKGYDAELVKGKGYCYFSGPAAESFFEQSVMVPRVSDLTLAEWLREFESKRKQAK